MKTHRAPLGAAAHLQTSSAAKWSAFLGIAGLLFQPLTIIGLPLAFVALRDIRRGARTGRGLALTGLWTNGAVWALWLLVLIVGATD